jgi:hypothetical protein
MSELERSNIFKQSGFELNKRWKLNLPLLPQRLVLYLNLLKSAGHVMHQQFNIQQLYALPTLYLCVLYLSENKQRLVSFTA